MALRFMDSFAIYATAQLPGRYEAVDTIQAPTILTAIVSSSTTAGPPPRTGTGCAQFNTSYCCLGKIQLGSITSIAQGAAFYDNNTSVNTWNPLLSISDSTGLMMIGLYSMSTGALKVCSYGSQNSPSQGQGLNDGNSAVIGTSALGALPRNTFAFVEWVVVCSTTATGSVVVNVNGVTVINLTNVITANTSRGSCVNGVVGYAYIGSPCNESQNPLTLWINDYHIFDTTGSANNGLSGDTRVTAMLPTAAGMLTQWAKTGGATNWQSVANDPPLTSQYVSSSTSGQIDAYTVGPLPSLTGVAAVQASMYSNKSDSATRQIALGLANGTTENFGSATAVAQLTTAKYYVSPFDQNPFTAAPWVRADLTTLQAAIKEVI